MDTLLIPCFNRPEQVYDYYYQPTMPETVEFALAGL